MAVSRLSAWAVALVVLSSAASAQAQSTDPISGAVGLSGGYNFDVEVPLVGVDALFTFQGMAVPLSIHPSFNYFFVESQEFLGVEFTTTLMQFDLNAIAHLPLLSLVTPFMGAGMAMLYTKTSLSGFNSTSSETETDFGANFLAGFALNLGPAIEPFAQLRLTLLDGSSVSFAMGVRFGF